MKKPGAYIDCCAGAELETAKAFLSTHTDMVSVRRCRHCGCHWFYRLRECSRGFANGEDAVYDRIIWYVRLDPAETAELLAAADPPAIARFADRPGFLMDADGMQPIRGIPRFLQ